MNPTAIIAAVAAVFVMLCAFLYHEGDKKTLKIGEQGAELRAAQVVEEYRERIDKLTAEYAERLDKVRRQDAQDIGDLRAQNNEWKLDAAKRAREDPFDFGDSLHNFFVGSMCRIAAGLDAEDRAACNNIAADAYTPGVALTVTVTPELAGDWAYRCELWRDAGAIPPGEERDAFVEQFGISLDDRDLCNWSITGFTPNGAGVVKDWWLSVEYNILELRRWGIGVEDHVDNLNNMRMGDGR